MHQFSNTRVELKPLFIECFKKKYKNFKLLAANAQSNKKKESDSSNKQVKLKCFSYEKPG